MANPYLDWIWSQYSIPKSSKQLSLQDSCSYFTKYILQPTDIILSNGGYVLHPDLTLPLTNIISGMDYFLDLASQHRGLQQLHSIGSKLSILTTPGMDSTPATQSQVVHNWVLLIDRILAAKHQLHALCFSNTSLRFLPKWDTQLASIASSLPQELRSRLPYDFIQRFNIQDTLPKKVTTRSESLHAPVTPHSSPADVSPALPAPGCPPSITADELAAQWAHLIKMPLDPSWTVKRGNKRCSLRTELLSIIVNGVDRMQTALTDIFRPSLLQPICFQVDPHGQLEQVLGGIDTLDTFAIAWDTLTERMRKASNTFQECQRKYQEEQDSQRTEGSNTPNTREDRTPSVSSIPASSAQCPASSGSLVDLGGQKCQQPSNIDEADRHTKGIQSIPSPSHAPPPSPAPPRVVDRVAVELGGRQMYQQHINAYAEARLTKNIQKPPSTSAPLLSPAPCSVLSERTVELGGRRDQQRVNPAIPIATHPSPPPFCVVNAGTSTAKLVGRSLDQQLDHARLGQRTNKPAVEKLCGDETLAAPLLPHGELGKRPALGDSTPHQSPTPLVIDSGSIGSGDTPSIVEFGGLQGTVRQKHTIIDKKTRTLDGPTGANGEPTGSVGETAMIPSSREHLPAKRIVTQDLRKGSGFSLVALRANRPSFSKFPSTPPAGRTNESGQQTHKAGDSTSRTSITNSLHAEHASFLDKHSSAAISPSMLDFKAFVLVSTTTSSTSAARANASVSGELEAINSSAKYCEQQNDSLLTMAVSSASSPPRFVDENTAARERKRPGNLGMMASVVRKTSIEELKRNDASDPPLDLRDTADGVLVCPVKKTDQPTPNGEGIPLVNLILLSFKSPPLATADARTVKGGGLPMTRQVTTTPVGLDITTYDALIRDEGSRCLIDFPRRLRSGSGQGCTSAPFIQIFKRPPTLLRSTSASRADPFDEDKTDATVFRYAVNVFSKRKWNENLKEEENPSAEFIKSQVDSLLTCLPFAKRPHVGNSASAVESEPPSPQFANGNGVEGEGLQTSASEMMPLDLGALSTVNSRLDACVRRTLTWIGTHLLSRVCALTTTNSPSSTAVSLTTDLLAFVLVSTTVRTTATDTYLVRKRCEELTPAPVWEREGVGTFVLL